jgi:hypothetical protein
MGAEVTHVGLELAALMFKLVGDVFLLLLQLPLLPRHYQLSPGDITHTPLEIRLQLCAGSDASIGLGMGFHGVLHELLGLLVEHTDGDMLFLEHLLHRVQVCPLVRCLLLLGLGPHLEQGAPLLEALLLRP